MGVGVATESRAAGSGCQAAIWRMPRKCPAPASICASSAGRGRGDEGGLPQRPEQRVAFRPVAGVAIDKDAGPHVMAAGCIGEEFLEPVRISGTVPEMMMRIHDRHLWLQRRFRVAGKPVGADGWVPHGRGSGRAHGRILQNFLGRACRHDAQPHPRHFVPMSSTPLLYPFRNPSWYSRIVNSIAAAAKFG